MPVECEHVDHRAVATWSHIAVGPDIVRELRAGVEVASDLRTRVDVLETAGEFVASCRQTCAGTFTGFRAEVSVSVSEVVVVRDGRFIRIENFDPGDQRAREG